MVRFVLAAPMSSVCLLRFGNRACLSRQDASFPARVKGTATKLLELPVSMGIRATHFFPGPSPVPSYELSLFARTVRIWMLLII
jgi:hypothetical protein